MKDTKKRKQNSPPPGNTAKAKKSNNNNAKKFDPKNSSPADQGFAAVSASGTPSQSAAADSGPVKSQDSEKSGKVKPIFDDASAKLVISHLEKLRFQQAVNPLRNHRR